MRKVLVALPVNEDEKRRMQAFEDDFVFCKPSDVSLEIMNDVQILMGNIDTNIIKECKDLKWIQLNSAGYERFIKPGIVHSDTLLTNASGAYGPAVAEHIVGMIMSLSKKLHLYRDNQHQHEWKDMGQVLPLHGRRILIVGLGDIGQETAKMLYKMGNKIVGIRRKTDERPDYIEKLVNLDELYNEIPDADIIITLIPLNETTKELINIKTFDLMKKNTIFINAGRGGLVDTEALYNALYEGRIWGAGLDTIDPEPLPHNHKLWSLDNVIITPHVAGGYHMEVTRQRIVELAIENYIRYKKNQPLINIIDH